MKLRIAAFFSVEQPLWFLHRERFRAAALALAESHAGYVHRALIATVCSFGARHASVRTLASLSRPLLETALEHLNDRIDPGNMQYENHALQLIQARVLLGGELMSSGQSLRGVTVLSGACSLALGLRLHNPYVTAGGIAIIPISIDAPTSPIDVIMRAERVGAFWIAATLDRLWALASGSRPRMNLDALQVRVPWMHRPEHYEQVRLSHLVALSNISHNTGCSGNVSVCQRGCSFIAGSSGFSFCTPVECQQRARDARDGCLYV